MNARFAHVYANLHPIRRGERWMGALAKGGEG